MSPSDSDPERNDSRTASIGKQQRARQNGTQEPPSKRQRRSRNTDSRSPRDVLDFVPRGASFSANGSFLGDDGTSSSGGEESSSGSGSDRDGEIGNGIIGSAPAPNWNKSRRSVIRTSLRGSRGNTVASTSAGSSLNANATVNASTDNADAALKFEAVNGMYWRSRSASASASAASPGREDGKKEESAASQLSGDSDDSESLDSEADDSIMLNIGARDRSRSQERSRSQNGVIAISDDDSEEVEDDDYDPASLPVSQTPATDDIFDTQNGVAETKESAFLRFAKKYPAAPTILADLDREDMELQSRTVFYDRDINEINLQLPISCIECLREGHLADVCPMKECVHCGAWNQHQSTLCPKWRRCQRCRERGHDHARCPSALKGSASEVPCDLCGSSSHLELDCDFLWKLPRHDTTAAPVLVSISCAHCTSNRHLMGDCPSLQRPLASSTFTLRGIDPNIITNINSVVNARRGGPVAGPSRGMKIRGRAEPIRSPSSDSEDMDMFSSRSANKRQKMSVGGSRTTNRGSIRIGSNIGQNKNLGPPSSSSRDYRDRDDPLPRGSSYNSQNNYNLRPRSMSPGPRGTRSGRGRGGKDSWQPSPRSPPRGQNRSSGPARGGRGGGNGGRGGGRGGGGKRGGNGGEAYRPLPSAAKKAWDKYRL